MQMSSCAIPSNRRLVNVVLLNDKIYSVIVEVSCQQFYTYSDDKLHHVQLSSKCQDVFNQVVSYLSLGEPHVFGLSIVKGVFLIIQVYFLVFVK